MIYVQSAAISVYCNDNNNNNKYIYIATDHSILLSGTIHAIITLHDLRIAIFPYMYFIYLLNNSRNRHLRKL